MKPACILAAMLLAAAPASAEVELRVSIKVILGPSGEWPDNTNTVGNPPNALNLNSEAVLRNNIAFTNSILSRHGTCYRLVLRNDSIITLSGFAPAWFTGDPRTGSYRAAVETQATASAAAKATWQWHDDSINIYLNDGRSGSCNFPAQGNVITIGAGAYDTIILHEIGHYLGLRHTHPPGDDAETDNTVDDWGNGDLSDATLDDDKDATAAQINARYNGLFPQTAIDDLVFNLMSYHIPQDRFVWDQREVLITHFNTTRANCALGRARFVMPAGNDSGNGLSVTDSLRTIGIGVLLSGPNDAVLIRSGSYFASQENLPLTLTTPVTLGAWRGPVTITR